MSNTRKATPARKKLLWKLVTVYGRKVLLLVYDFITKGWPFVISRTGSFLCVWHKQSCCKFACRRYLFMLSAGRSILFVLKNVWRCICSFRKLLSMRPPQPAALNEALPPFATNVRYLICSQCITHRQWNWSGLLSSNRSISTIGRLSCTRMTPFPGRTVRPRAEYRCLQ